MMAGQTETMTLQTNRSPRAGLATVTERQPGRLAVNVVVGLTVAIAALAMGGCTTSREVYLANGMRAYQLDCRSTLHGLTSCYEAASELCGRRGFAIYDWSGIPWKEPYPDPDGLDSKGIMAIDRILVACRA